MKYDVIVTYRAFPPCPPSIDARACGNSVEEALEDLWRAFNHAIPGVTGELAEKHGVRSMSVGDEVYINGRTYVCAPLGFVDTVKDPNILNDFMIREARKVRA